MVLSLDLEEKEEKEKEEVKGKTTVKAAGTLKSAKQMNVKSHHSLRGPMSMVAIPFSGDGSSS